MVKEQIISRGITNEMVLEAFRRVPRHNFIPEKYLDIAYTDRPLPIGEGQTISQPYMVALMTELLELTGDERILEIGTGSGYQTAILAELAAEVYTIERIKSLSENAQKILNELKYSTITLKCSDGTLGWEEFSPYQGILVTAGTPKIPELLIDQLDEGGRIVIPIGESSSQMLTLIEKKNGKVTQSFITECVFVPLIGRYGWSNYA